MVDIVKFSTFPEYLNESFLKREYVDSGLSLRKIAKKHKCSRGTIKKRLEAEGIRCFVSSTERIEIKPQILNRIMLLRAEGMSYQKIAKVLNIEKIPTRTKKGCWHGKTVRDQVLVL